MKGIINLNDAYGVDDDYRGGQEVGAGSFETGKQYVINVVGDTDWASIGATTVANSAVFTATGAGSGTGTAYKYDGLYKRFHSIMVRNSANDLDPVAYPQYKAWVDGDRNHSFNAGYAFNLMYPFAWMNNYFNTGTMTKGDIWEKPLIWARAHDLLSDLDIYASISNSTEAYPSDFTSINHGLTTGEPVLLSGLNGSGSVHNDHTYYVKSIDGNTIQLYYDSNLVYPVGFRTQSISFVSSTNSNLNDPDTFTLTAPETFFESERVLASEFNNSYTFLNGNHYYIKEIDSTNIQLSNNPELTDLVNLKDIEGDFFIDQNLIGNFKDPFKIRMPIGIVPDIDDGDKINFDNMVYDQFGWSLGPNSGNNYVYPYKDVNNVSGNYYLKKYAGTDDIYELYTDSNLTNPAILDNATDEIDTVYNDWAVDSGGIHSVWYGDVADLPAPFATAIPGTTYFLYPADQYPAQPLVDGDCVYLRRPFPEDFASEGQTGPYYDYSLAGNDPLAVFPFLDMKYTKIVPISPTDERYYDMVNDPAFTQEFYGVELYNDPALTQKAIDYTGWKGKDVSYFEFYQVYNGSLYPPILNDQGNNMLDVSRAGWFWWDDIEPDLSDNKLNDWQNRRPNDTIHNTGWIFRGEYSYYIDNGFGTLNTPTVLSPFAGMTLGDIANYTGFSTTGVYSNMRYTLVDSGETYNGKKLYYWTVSKYSAGVLTTKPVGPDIAYAKRNTPATGIASNLVYSEINLNASGDFKLIPHRPATRAGTFKIGSTVIPATSGKLDNEQDVYVPVTAGTAYWDYSTDNLWGVDNISFESGGNTPFQYRNTSGNYVNGVRVKGWWNWDNQFRTFAVNPGVTFGQTGSGYLNGSTLTSPGEFGVPWLHEGQWLLMEVEPLPDTYVNPVLSPAELADAFPDTDYWTNTEFDSRKEWPTTKWPVSTKLNMVQPDIATKTLTGIKYVRSGGFTRWQAELNYGPLTREQFDDFFSFVQEVRGQKHPFLLKMILPNGQNMLFGNSATATGEVYAAQPQTTINDPIVVEGFDSFQQNLLPKGSVFTTLKNDRNGYANTQIAPGGDANAYGEALIRPAWAMGSLITGGDVLSINPSHITVTMAENGFEYSVDRNELYYFSVTFDLDEWK